MPCCCSIYKLQHTFPYIIRHPSKKLKPSIYDGEVLKANTFQQSSIGGGACDVAKYASIGVLLVVKCSLCLESPDLDGLGSSGVSICAWKEHGKESSYRTGLKHGICR